MFSIYKKVTCSTILLSQKNMPLLYRTTSCNILCKYWQIKCFLFVSFMTGIFLFNVTNCLALKCNKFEILRNKVGKIMKVTYKNSIHLLDRWNWRDSAMSNLVKSIIFKTVIRWTKTYVTEKFSVGKRFLEIKVLCSNT